MPAGDCHCSLTFGSLELKRVAVLEKASTREGILIRFCVSCFSGVVER